MVKITFENVLMSEEQIEKLRVYCNTLLNEDLQFIPDTFINGFYFASDEELHIKPIYECEEVKDALELCRIAKESHCNTNHDSMGVWRL